MKSLVEKGLILSYPPPSEEEIELVNSNLEASNSLTEISLNDIFFQKKLINLLKPLGFPIRIGENSNKDIILSISQICKFINEIEK